MAHRKHIHCIGIWGIGISALARYYFAQGYRVTGTNLGHSPLLDTLEKEWIEIVENGSMMIDRETTKVIYTEAIIDDEKLGLDGVRAEHLPEISVAQFYHIPLFSYPEALAEIFHTFPIKIAVAGAHGKSTTSAMIGTLLHDNQSPATTITGTLVKAFWGKNICIEGDDIMTIEACEYRNAFLKYKPDIAVITNIDPDHLDFFKTEEAYFESFQKFMEQSRCVVIPAEEYHNFQNKRQNNGLKKTLPHPEGAEQGEWTRGCLSGCTPPTPSKKGELGDTTLVIVYDDHFEVIGDEYGVLVPGKYTYMLPKLLVPWHHTRIDASLAYVTSQILSIDPKVAMDSLVQYPGSWRRMEIIKTTNHNNLLMSDYGHHPTEIIATLWALRGAYPERKIIVFFEPHQYSRTYELREEFAGSFSDADMTYISDIYAARDIDERRDMIDARVLATMIARSSPCDYVGTLEDAGQKLKEIDAEETGVLILLLGAGTIDELRTEI